MPLTLAPSRPALKARNKPTLVVHTPCAAARTDILGAVAAQQQNLHEVLAKRVRLLDCIVALAGARLVLHGSVWRPHRLGGLDEDAAVRAAGLALVGTRAGGPVRA